MNRGRRATPWRRRGERRLPAITSLMAQRHKGTNSTARMTAGLGEQLSFRYSQHSRSSCRSLLAGAGTHASSAGPCTAMHSEKSPKDQRAAQAAALQDALLH